MKINSSLPREVLHGLQDMNKMKNKILLLFFVAILLVASFNFVLAVGENTVCCEKTLDGAWCQNAPEDECNTNYRNVPTSCEATGYCKLGCCYDSQEGTCMENTPQVVCNENGGIWSGDSRECEIPQCNLGCCLVGDQAAFVTQTRCKRLSALYGLETNFRSDISNEVSCIATATSDTMGACEYEEEYQKTCKMITQKECKDLETVGGVEKVKFHEGWLCSADELGTNCGPSKKTACVEGRDEVYFLDTCGNLANIYDSNRINDKEYWTRMIGKDESCGSDVSNAASGKCGNCDYYLGSTCKAYDRTNDRVRPEYGDNICRDLSCDFEEEHYEHGETWCTTNSRTLNLPGSEYYRMVCYNGDVTIEPCASFRAEICIESDIDGFKTAACRVNRWQDCLAQDNEKDCENMDRRDCKWVFSGERGDINEDGKIEDIYACVAQNPPGFDFWNTGEDGTSESEDICSIANSDCTAVFEKRLYEKTWQCKENCQCCVNGEDEEGNKYEGCTGEKYEDVKDALCGSLGDCGKKTNFVGAKGYNFDDDSLICNGGDCFWTL